MDKVAKYKAVIHKEFKRLANYRSTFQPGIEYQLLENEDGTNLAILVVGWHKDKYHNFVMYQVEIKHGKVKIMADNTDSSIAERLEELGIPASDILFTYLEPELEKSALEIA